MANEFSVTRFLIKDGNIAEANPTALWSGTVKEMADTIDDIFYDLPDKTYVESIKDNLFKTGCTVFETKTSCIAVGILDQYERFIIKGN